MAVKPPAEFVEAARARGCRCATSTCAVCEKFAREGYRHTVSPAGRAQCGLAGLDGSGEFRDDGIPLGEKPAKPCPFCTAANLAFVAAHDEAIPRPCVEVGRQLHRWLGGGAYSTRIERVEGPPS